MSRLRLAAAILLALPLVVFGGNYFIQIIPMPEQPQGAGPDLLQAMRDGGLMAAIALSHVIIGLGLIIKKLRFASALLQLPMSLGMVAFHLTMMPEGLAVVLIMLVLNVIVLFDTVRLNQLLH